MNAWNAQCWLVEMGSSTKLWIRNSRQWLQHVKNSQIQSTESNMRVFAIITTDNSFNLFLGVVGGSIRMPFKAHPNQPDSLQSHPCSLCGKIFVNHTMLSEHFGKCQRKKYGCPVCGVRTLAPSHLRKHMEIHKKWMMPNIGSTKLFRTLKSTSSVVVTCCWLKQCSFGTFSYFWQYWIMYIRENDVLYNNWQSGWERQLTKEHMQNWIFRSISLDHFWRLWRFLHEITGFYKWTKQIFPASWGGCFLVAGTWMANQLGGEYLSAMHCPYCSKVLITQEAFDQHFNMCSKMRYVCNVCGRRCPKPSNLRTHMKIHEK